MHGARQRRRELRGILVDRIKRRLCALDLTERAAGKRAGNAATIRSITRDDDKWVLPGIDTLQRIAAALETSVGYLIGERVDEAFEGPHEIWMRRAVADYLGHVFEELGLAGTDIDEAEIAARCLALYRQYAEPDSTARFATIQIDDKIVKFPRRPTRRDDPGSESSPKTGTD